ncbi:hypothetical protein pEaSNUABM9_00236 [Erwinia phage pEa_SNUABM_9]|nr:hypothetical protein pEaSNUABM9_00236 [Erwinia phage pEa_SNUABM_9]
MNKEPLVIVPLFEEHMPVRDPIVNATLAMLRKAYTMAFRKHHRITIGIIPISNDAVSFVSDMGLYAYMALSRLKKDDPEAKKIIKLLSDMYEEYKNGVRGTYTPTPMMYKLAKEDGEFGVSKRSLLLQKQDAFANPREPEISGCDSPSDLGDIFLTSTSNLPEAMKLELAWVLDRWNTGNNEVLDQADMDLIPTATEVVVEYNGEGVYRVTLHAVCHEIEDRAMRMIVARLKGKGERGCSYHLEGKGQLFVEIDSLKKEKHQLVIDLVKTGIQNNVVHTVLDICAKRYENEIVLKPRKK